MNPRDHRKHASHDRWLVSYADFITLLFAFFVVLYAFAKADHKKQAEISNAIDGAFRSLGAFPDAKRNPSSGDKAVMPLNIVMGEDVMSPARVKNDLEHMRLELRQTLSNQVAHHTVSIELGRDGLVISLREAGFFNSGSATPRPETLDTLKQIVASVGQTPYDVRVEGHTDNIPIHTDKFDSNWELSSARALQIAKMVLATHTIAPDRISAAGYAEFHPVDSNDTPEGRAKNRRVDLVILPRAKINFAAPDPANVDGPWAKITDVQLEGPG
jgi:chemotaxis protein MotB